ncbi:EAL domain-containing protein [Paenalkalicoccus suaedae]|uniref:EAL domain-containing protein n=1 Tax=Paenalkalicoccus suaedae TaxID=2592382 RepID=A0A859FJH1_9BACI|nr:EAL domain-containing protein [Paenalkalicoccus suaedae]QKS72951.1 EAL domain-containing protein [Paenalkalicoccus suaedae]
MEIYDMKADPHYLFHFFSKLYNMVFLMKVTDRGVVYEAASEEAVLLATLPEGFKGKTIAEVYAPDVAKNLIYQYNLACNEQEPVFYSDKMNKKTNVATYASSILLPIHDTAGKVRYVLGITSDLADRAMLQLLASIEDIDYLTKLPTIVKVKAEVNILLQSQEHVSVHVLYINIDRFKLANEFLGVEKANVLLQQIANSLSRVSPKGSIIGRVEADEFIVALTNVSLSDAKEVAKQIIKSIKQITYDVNNMQIPLSCCVGICTNYKSANTLITNAQHAMLEAKHTGNGSINVYDQTVKQQKYLDDLTLEIELMKAIQSEELTVYYQPKIHSQTGHVNVEALVRWFSQSLGTIPPSVFIPIAEKSPLIEKVTERVVTKVCEDITRFPDIFEKTITSINLSSTMFDEKIVQNSIVSIIKKYGLTPDRFELEITEYTLMKDVERGKETIDFLRGLGFRVVIDDFGVSYSSLNYLKLFSLDGIKIDQSFVQQIDNEEESKEIEIVTFILMLAQKLGLHVTAEGVETESQLTILTDLGCDELQGYYLSKPMAIDALYHASEQASDLIVGQRRTLYLDILHKKRQKKVEAERLLALESLKILGTHFEEAYDRITRVVSQSFQVPLCLITYLTDDTQWIKSASSYRDMIRNNRSVPRDQSFCTKVIDEKDYFIVEDTYKHEELKSNKYVKNFGIRFYAGVPLFTSEGYAIGTLCILDVEPRVLSSDDITKLTEYSHWVMAEMQIRVK